jgi:hypothetical protein
VNDMMHSTGALIALVVVVLVIVFGLFAALRVAGARVHAGDEHSHRHPPEDPQP